MLLAALLAFMGMALAAKCPRIHERLDFFVLGDWGNSLENYEQKVADAMTLMHQNDPTCCDFVVTLGDNFYAGQNTSNGVASVKDAKWDNAWKNVFKSVAELPWIGVLGNHDWYGSPEAQLEYHKVDRSWQIEDFFWSKEFKLATPHDRKSATATFLFIETDLIYYGYNVSAGPNPSQIEVAMGENFERLGWTQDNKTIDHHLEVIESMLKKAASSEFVFVVGHHPLGVCPDASPTGKMTELMNLLFKYSPTAYMFGHQHSLQFADINDVFFILSGSVGYQEPVCTNSVGEFGLNKTSGFVRATLTSSLFSLNYHGVQADAKPLFTKSKGPRIV